jgi:hypothetical protein
LLCPLPRNNGGERFEDREVEEEEEEEEEVLLTMVPMVTFVSPVDCN